MTPSQQTIPGPWANELSDLVRGASGGFLFSIPLFYTLEVWQIGSHVAPPRLLLTLAATGAVVFLLNLLGGFRRDAPRRPGALALETVEAMGYSLLFSGLLLVLLRRITPDTPLLEALGKLVFAALPFAVGMALGNQLLSGDRISGAGAGPSGGQGGLRATLNDLGASAIGAVFIAFSVAPTEEIVTLSTALSPPWLLALVGFTLLVTYGIVFAAGFAGAEGRRRQPGLLQSPVAETVASYLVALLVSALMLALYDHLRPGDPWAVWLGRTIVLGLPAAVGGAAGRLAV